VLRIRGAMGAPRKRKRWVLGALAATVGALWMAACDVPVSRTGTPSPGTDCLNPHPLPPENCAENSSSSSSGGGSSISGSSSSGGVSSGRPTEDGGVFDAESHEAGASADAAPEGETPEGGAPEGGTPDGGSDCPLCPGVDSGDAAPADGSLDAP
jgi:hypothetical protein